MLHNKNILVVVPARGGSKGIPLKNIYPLHGIPLIGYTGEVLKKLSYVDRAVVSTDHQKIADVAKEYGIDAPFMRPEYLSGDRIGDWDVLHHALCTMEEKDQKSYDVIVMLQPTSPKRTPDHVTQTINELIEKDLDSVWTLSLTDSKHHPLKQLTVENGQMGYYDKNGSKIIARQQLTPLYHRNGIAYALTRECLENQKTIKGAKSGAVIIEDPVVNIDTEYDIKLAEFLMPKP